MNPFRSFASRPLRGGAVLSLSILAACGGGGGGGGGPAFNQVTAAQAIQTYANIMLNSYDDVIARTQTLKAAVDLLVATPNQLNLDAARTAWSAVRPFYIQTEIGRFYDGPIDDGIDGPEIFMNAWPIDESHIDYVTGDATSGIINDPGTYPTINEATLRAANEAGGEENISCGWHAIEFLLWGQDANTAGPGARPFTDFLTTGGTAANQARRGTYLTLATQLLIDDLVTVRDEWALGTGTYRTELLSLPVATALGRIMTGMGTLAFGELRGERILVPYSTKLQEDEHSCFSDTTHLDHRNDLIGIRNVWFGTYVSSDGTRNVSGTSLKAVAETADAVLAAQITARLDALLVDLQSGTLNPFDQAIQGLDTTPGRMTLTAILQGLSDFNDKFSALAADMGVNITTN